MKKILIIASLFLLHFAVRAQQILVDANVTPRSLQGQFENVKVSGNIKLILSQGDAVSLAVSAAQEKYIADITTVVENNTLYIDWSGDKNWGKNRQLTVYLGFKQMSALAASGASSIIAVGSIRQDALRVDLSGASTMTAGFDLQSFTISLSGASEAKLEGKVQKLNINSSGASDVNAYELVAVSCSASASGASDLKVHASLELDAVASGASHIYYKGNAEKINTRNNGVSKIERRN